MQKTKKAFTMIEMIFVIVILGILAAVALPKLAAPRDDARISTVASDLAIAISDIGSYYMSTGKFGTIGSMSNVNFIEDDSTDMSSGSSVTYEVSQGAGVCLTFTTTSDGNLTVAHTGADSGVVCTEIALLKTNLIKTFSFAGSRVIQ